MPRRISAVLFALITSWTASGETYTISTFAGGGLPAYIPGTSAHLYGPQAVAVDNGGNVFFVDTYDVLRLDAATGILTLVAGNGTQGFSGDNGLATRAQLDQPTGVAVDATGILYIADLGNNRVRKVTNGVIATVAGNGTPGFSGDNGPAANAQLNQPWGLAVDSAGNLYIADAGNHCIRMVSGGTITTVAGNGARGSGGDNGPAASAQLNSPEGAAVDSAGNLYIADTGNSRIRKVSNGTIATLAGNGAQAFAGDNGPAARAVLNWPSGVAVDSAGNVYIADADNSRIREISNGLITTVAGSGTQGYSGDSGLAVNAQLGYPGGVAVDAAGNLYIADPFVSRIRKVSGGVIHTVAGGGASLGDNGPPAGAQLNYPYAAAVDAAGNLYIADQFDNRIRKVSGGAVATAAGNDTPILGDNGPAVSAWLYNPQGVALDSTGNLYIADTLNQRIRKVSNGIITTVAGIGTFNYSGDGGPAAGAQLDYPTGIAVDAAGNLYIADSRNNRIRKISNGTIATVAGNGTPGYSGDGGPATGAELNWPSGLAVDSAGNLYIADRGNSRVRKVSRGAITTVAGGGALLGDDGPATNAQLSYPEGVAVDAAGNLYIADSGNNRIRKVSNGIIATVAGSGTPGLSGDGGSAASAELKNPTGIAVDPAGELYIADSGNNRIRLVTPGTQPAISPVATPIQPGSWVSIYGSNLASETALWNGDFPISLGGTSVTIDNKPAYLWYVSPTQINLQAPDDTATGPVSIVVATASGTASSTVTLAPYGPSFSLLGDGKHVAGEIVTPDGVGAYGGGTYDLAGPSNTFSYETRPVKAGETLVLFGVGFGPTAPSVPAGRAFSGAVPTSSPVAIAIGGVAANVVFAGLTGAGLYQFNLVVPPGIGSGDRALQATVNGVPTPSGPVVAVQ